MTAVISRRDFLKSSLIATGVFIRDVLPPLPEQEEVEKPLGLGRVTVDYINIYSEPDFGSDRIKKVERDRLIWLFGEIRSPHGPSYNPVWYKARIGYAHSAYLQRVELRHLNIPLAEIPYHGILGQVTVPYTTSFRLSRMDGWLPLYRLYYQSIHWITSILPGPDRKPWYRITDHLLMVDYYAPARHIRHIPSSEFAPISTDISPDDKRVEISIESQTLSAYEGSNLIRQFKVSTGVPSRNHEEGEIPTDTPRGSFRIQTKMPSRHMGDGILTSDFRDYELPGVPWTMLFHETGVAAHGTYWHNNFGVRMSHGCVNMRNGDAKWLFRWTYPIFEPQNYYIRQEGTHIKVI